MAQRSLYDEHGERYILTQGEMGVLAALADNPGTVLSRSQLLHHVSERPNEASVRTVDVLISRLRRKLEDHPGHPALIVTARGEGYVLIGARH